MDVQQPKAQVKCLDRVKHLAKMGHEIRRPDADYLRDGIYELRLALNGVQYRTLYFFHGRIAVVLTHGFIKKGPKVPDKEIERALRCKALFESDPDRHTYRGEASW
ncbi:MAG: type II toxin-antitoxin system RelE/ParE family toxin [Candidatus Sumerlaeota bacterium]|nr:type II toxin-antitoxin system RelE/ParE family toxin [Candidatus Sumerlaeota bacterium]